MRGWISNDITEKILRCNYLSIPYFEIDDVSKRGPSSDKVMKGAYAKCWSFMVRSMHNRNTNMMTSSNGNIFRVTAICAAYSPVPGEFPAQRPVTRNFDVFFDLRLNKWLSKQSWGWWFETLSRPLWRHCNDSWWWAMGVLSFYVWHILAIYSMVYTT